MKRSEAIFFSVLIASVFILAACQVSPGQAVSKKTAVVQPAATTSGSGGAMPICVGAGQGGCGSAGDDLACCAGTTCVSGICIAQNTSCTTTCTPGTFCSGNTKINVSSNCQSTSTNCPNGCANGNCLPPPQQNCTVSNICSGNNLIHINANCTNSTTYCQYGCANGACNPPSNTSCTPSYTCVGSGSYSNYTTSNCSSSLTLCQYGCNLTSGLCNSTSGCIPGCFDTDGGINMYVAGTVSFNNCTGVVYNYTDTCNSGQSLHEEYCSGGVEVFTNINCPANMTCLNGKCQ